MDPAIQAMLNESAREVTALSTRNLMLAGDVGILTAKVKALMEEIAALKAPKKKK